MGKSALVTGLFVIILTASALAYGTNDPAKFGHPSGKVLSGCTDCISTGFQNGIFGEGQINTQGALNALKEVDGSGSGLDADKLDGKGLGQFCRSGGTNCPSGGWKLDYYNQRGGHEMQHKICNECSGITTDFMVSCGNVYRPTGIVEIELDYDHVGSQDDIENSFDTYNRCYKIVEE